MVASCVTVKAVRVGTVCCHLGGCL